RGDDRGAVSAGYARVGRPGRAGGSVSERQGRSERIARCWRQRGLQARAPGAVCRDGRNVLPRDVWAPAAARGITLDRRRRDERQRTATRSSRTAKKGAPALRGQRGRRRSFLRRRGCDRLRWLCGKYRAKDLRRPRGADFRLVAKEAQEFPGIPVRRLAVPGRVQGTEEDD